MTVIRLKIWGQLLLLLGLAVCVSPLPPERYMWVVTNLLLGQAHGQGDAGRAIRGAMQACMDARANRLQHIFQACQPGHWKRAMHK